MDVLVEKKENRLGEELTYRVLHGERLSPPRNTLHRAINFLGPRRCRNTLHPSQAASPERTRYRSLRNFWNTSTMKSN